MIDTSTGIEGRTVQALKELTQYGPGILQELITSGDDDLGTILKTRSSPLNIGLIEPDESTRVAIRNALNEFGAETMSKGEKFKVFSYSSMDHFLKAVEKNPVIFQAVYIRESLLNNTLKERICLSNESLASRNGHYPGFSIFTDVDIERAAQRSFAARYKQRTPLRTIIVASESREAFGERGAQMLNLLEDPERIKMFNTSYLVKPKVEESLRQGNALPADLIIFDLSEGSLDDYSNLRLLKDLIKLNQNSFVIATVTDDQYKSIHHGEHRDALEQRYLPGGTSELTKIFRLTFDPEKGYDAKTLRDFFIDLRKDYREHVIRYWDYVRGHIQVFGLPMPSTAGAQIQEEQIADLAKKIEAVEQNVPLGVYSTMGLGGIGKCVVHPNSLEEYQAAIQFCLANRLQHSIMGNGSNTIPGNIETLVTTLNLGGVLELRIDDKRYRLDGMEGDQLKDELEKMINPLSLGQEVFLQVEAGVPLPRIASLSQYLGLAGAEFLIRIPGQSGGGVMMNCGVGDVSMSTILQDVTVINQNGEPEVLTDEALRAGWGYRLSPFQNTQLPIYSVTLRLKKGDKPRIAETTQIYKDGRKDEPNEPYEGHVGSMFLRRGYSGRGEPEIYHLEELLGIHILGMVSNEGNLKVPKQIRSASWVVANRDGPRIQAALSTRPISLATMYELGELFWRIGQEGKNKGITLYLEVKFLGRDNYGDSLHNHMQNILAGVIHPDDLQKGALDIGGKYLPK